MRPSDRLTKVVLASSNYDPQVGSGTALRARSEFDVADGYVLEVSGAFVLVTHGGRTAGYPMSAVKYVLVEREQSDVPLPTAQPQQQWKGKRR